MAAEEIHNWSLPGPKFLVGDTRDVARLFGVSVDTIREWVRTGKFPTGQLSGGEMTWTGADIAAYLQLRGRLSVLEEKPRGKQTD